MAGVGQLKRSREARCARADDDDGSTSHSRIVARNDAKRNDPERSLTGQETMQPLGRELWRAMNRAIGLRPRRTAKTPEPRCAPLDLAPG